MNQNESSRRLLLQSSNSSQQQHSTNSNFALDDRPPILEPEDGNGSRIVVERGGPFLDNATIHHEQPAYSMMGGESDDQNPYLLGDEYYVDHGVLYQKAATTNLPSSHSQHQQSSSMGKINSHSRMATIGATMHQIQQQEEQTIISLAPNYSQQQNAPSEMDMLANQGNGGIEATTNICCGLCGAIVLYEEFVPDHLPTFHPEVLVDGVIDLEEIPYETWLNEQHAKGDEKIGGSKMFNRRPSVGAGRRQHRHQPLFIPPPVYNRHHQTSQLFGQLRSTRQLRRISQYRVNTTEMSIPELEMALQKKMVEKMGRKVPVSLMDKLHAKCGLCDTVISLNKKFEIVHLVRHFNAWHPTAHKCAGTWPNKELPTPGSTGKPLSAQDFAVVDPDPEAADNLQCIWCGMFMSNRAIGMHFHEIHPEEVEVPKCNLCMQELLINARFAERYSEDFWVTLPDEHTFRSIRFKRDFKSEAALERAIMKYLKRIQEGADPNLVDVEDLDEPDEAEEYGEGGEGAGQQLLSCRAFQNSAMVCGKRAKPKRQFIMPIVRQAAPVDSKFVTAITHSHWKCKLCGADIFAAVISAGVIKHFKKAHPNELPRVQLELCQARLDKVSDGNMEMEMLTEQNLLSGVCNIKCKLCHHTLPMTPPFNICRAIRHIKIKHPEVMPEHKGGESSRGTFPSAAELAEMDEMAALKNRIMGEQELLDFAAQQPSTSAAADIADVKDGGHDLEPGVIYADELLDYSVIEMLRNNYNVNFDRVFTIFGSEIDQEIFILTMAGEELDSQTVEEIVKVRDPTQNPMVVMLNQLGALVDADSITQ